VDHKKSLMDAGLGAMNVRFLTKQDKDQVRILLHNTWIKQIISRHEENYTSIGNMFHKPGLWSK
jgi:hypothetical protein